MVTNLAPAKTPTYVKVTGYPGLYRHSRSGRYYGCKKLGGIRRECSLRTSDRKIAERRLKEWVGNMDKVDAQVEKTTIGQLVGRFEVVTGGMATNTHATNRAVINCFLAWWPHGKDFQVRNVRVSWLDEWLALQEPRLRNVSYNRYALFLKQLFDIAVKDRIIAESPARSLRVPWKKIQTPKRIVPTAEQFEAILEDIRLLPLSLPQTQHTKDTADFFEFLGLAGLGQAEAASLTWGDVDWQRDRINVRRRKTDVRFHVPIYAHLRPLLVRLKEQTRGRVPASAEVFKIKDAKKALAAACIRLKFPAFSQRSLRQHLIGRLWKAGVDKKLIARWQGHQDGGQLIMDTYTEVFGADDEDYERSQLEKISGGSRDSAVVARVAQFCGEDVGNSPSGDMRKSKRKATPKSPSPAADSVPVVESAPLSAGEDASASASSAPAMEAAPVAPTAVAAPTMPTSAENPYKKGDKVITKCKGQEAEAEVTAVFKGEVQVRTPDGELRWRTIRTVTGLDIAPSGSVVAIHQEHRDSADVKSSERKQQFTGVEPRVSCQGGSSHKLRHRNSHTA